jgi:hypothetical protein
MCQCSVCGVRLHCADVHVKVVQSCEGITYIHISFRGKSRTCEKDDAPYMADKNPSKYRARFVIFEEKPFKAYN